MATLTIRNLPDETQRALKARAARNDRSMEAEVRDILQNAVASEQDFITGWLASAESLRGEFTLPEADGEISRGTQLPMPAELLAGVATFLKEDVAAQLDSHGNFLARVAANSLGIAQRELQYGGELAAQEQRRLQALLGQDGDLDTLRWELVHRLRKDLPLDTPGLAEHLRQTVAGQLAIDQPRYSALRRRG